MTSVVCPSCGKGFRLDEDEAVLYERTTCPHCDALLEVIDENPPLLEEVEDF